MNDNENLSLKDLSYKTVMLLALITTQRGQFLSNIKLENMFVSEDKIIIRVTELLKTARPGYKNPEVCLTKFIDRPRLCALF